MKRWWLISAIGAVSALALLQLIQPDAASPASVHDNPPESTEAQPPAAAPVETATPVDTVRVEHVLVEAEQVTPIGYPEVGDRGRYTHAALDAEPPQGAVGWTSPAPRPAPALNVPQTGVEKTSPALLERAKRALLGDGRHRPEPFPRVKDN
jgi:hypothetical protein